jgi:hypothetical protein
MQYMCDVYFKYSETMPSCYMYRALINNMTMRSSGLLKNNKLDLSFSSKFYQDQGLRTTSKVTSKAILGPLGVFSCLQIKRYLLDPYASYRSCLQNVTDIQEIDLRGHYFNFIEHGILFVILIRNFPVPPNNNIVVRIGYNGENNFNETQRAEIQRMVHDINKKITLAFSDDSLEKALDEVMNSIGGSNKGNKSNKRKKRKGSKSKKARRKSCRSKVK